ncbi:radical SAM protein [bacterium]|jgi:MoaA/NifB/PqqE/SkfB family radical SAM enzyme|nr:radical SAM protein [bacterium]MDB4128515.1 radical SAM protein [bacterium]MDC1257284.1 radical SAM protein [bacterium]
MNFNRVVEFGITNHCQAKCPACARTGLDFTLEHMNVKTFEKAIQHQPLQDTLIRLCGEIGDAMMHPDIEQFVEIALARTKKVTISTNGGLRNPEWYTYMGQKFGDRLAIIFGIDGTDSETNNMYRIGVDYERAMDNMKAYADSPGKAVWQFIVFVHNMHQLSESKLMATQIGAKHLFLINRDKFNGLSDKQEQRVLEQYEADKPLWRLK